MAANPKSRDEPLYVISVAAKLVNLHPQTLRHYERLGLVVPSRSEGNLRLYSDRDIERLRKIARLIDDLGVNLAGVEVILNMGEQIEELQERVEQLETKVATYERTAVEIARRRTLRRLEDSAARRPLLPSDNNP